MKRLGLLRHAKSSWDDSGLTDFDRPLTARGEKAARRMGMELRRREIAFDQVLASPARRVVDTIARFETGYGNLPPIRFERRVYAADNPTLVDIVRGADDDAGRLLLIGHNPGLAELAALLADKNEPLYGPLSAHFPTAAFALLELPATRWADVAPGMATILEYLKPRELVENG